MASKLDQSEPSNKSLSEATTLVRGAPAQAVEVATLVHKRAGEPDVASAQTMLAPSTPPPADSPRLRIADSEAGRDTQVDKTTPGLWGKQDSQPDEVDPAPATLGTERYLTRRTLGEGGMGEVVLATDTWLGRDVAKKTIREADASGTWGRRFVREARIQGQLEHPNIVPVYDLGFDSHGSPTFTMKRVQGLTLRHALEKLRGGSEQAEAAFSKRKLLGVISQTALALAYAHARGVVHRDLKPENIMLGEFGEVYLLDWGVAKTMTADDDEAPLSKNAPSLPPPDADLQTAAGVLVGTPGYMAPEQARGDAHLASPESDVYALGLILFEILCGEPAHQGKSLHAILASTMQADGLRPRNRVPGVDVPPELDEVCYRATRLEKTDRIASMRQFADLMDKYLDGERDVERRRELANAHLARAEELLDLANGPRSTRGPQSAEHTRAEGLRELGKALALEPTDRALTLLTRSILVDDTDDLPAEVEADLRAVGLNDRRQAARRTLAVYGFWVLVIAGTLWMGFRNVIAAGLIDLLLLATVLYTAWMVRSKRTEPRYMRNAIILNFLLVGSLASFVGPYFVVPAVAIMMASTMIVSLRANRKTRGFITASAAASVLVPAVLEWRGVLPRSYAFEDGVMKVLPGISHLPALPTEVALLGAALGTILLNGLLVGRSTQALLEAERKNYAQAYRLKQLLPQGAGNEPKGGPESESLGGAWCSKDASKRSTQSGSATQSGSSGS